MKDLSVEAEIEAPFHLYCGKDDTQSGITRQEASPIGLRGVILNGAQAESVFAEHEQGLLASVAENVRGSLEAVELPLELTARKKFISEWASKAKKASKKGGAFSVLLLPLAACGGGDSSSTSASSSTTGYVIDGYIKNAFLFRDEDGDGAFDAGEASAYTNDFGQYTLGGSSTASIVVDPSQDPEGRTAVDLDKPDEIFSSVLKAPAGATMVTPLTTIVQQIVENAAADGETVSVQDAETSVKAALGISANVNLSTLDPIASDNAEVYKAGVQVAGLMSAAGGGAAGLEVTKSLAETVKVATADLDNVDTAAVNLTDAAAVEAIVVAAKNANPDIMADVDESVVASTSSAQAAVVAAAEDVDDVASVQAAKFIVSESTTTNEISFSGTATGSVTMILNDTGGATFSRAGVQGKDSDAADAAQVTIGQVSSKSIGGEVDLVVAVGGSASDGNDEFVINAPSANSITVRGDTKGGADAIVIKVADLTPGTSDVRMLTVNTADLSVSSSDTIVFDFEGAEDLVILDASSELSKFDTVEVAKGTADLRSVDLKDGVDLIVSSSILVTETQYDDLGSVFSSSGDGRIFVEDTNGDGVISSDNQILGAEVIISQDLDQSILFSSYEFNV